MALIFEKTSTRTRCSFRGRGPRPGHGSDLPGPVRQPDRQKGVHRRHGPGAGPACLTASSTAATARPIVEELAHYAGVPVWNGLTNEYHPTQILADFLTHPGALRQAEGHQLRLLRRRPLQHGQQPDGGLRQDGPALLWPAHPKTTGRTPSWSPSAGRLPPETGATITLSEEDRRQVPPRGRCGLHRCVGQSMGEPVEVWAERINALAPYQVNAAADGH